MRTNDPRESEMTMYLSTRMVKTADHASNVGKAPGSAFARCLSTLLEFLRGRAL